MSNINERVGLNIRRIREEKSLSQEKLAEIADLHRTYIGQIQLTRRRGRGAVDIPWRQRRRLLL